MRNNGGGNQAFEGQVEADAAAIAVTSDTKGSDTGLLQSGDDLLDDWLRGRGTVLAEPCTQVEVSGLQRILGSSIPAEHVGDDGLETVPREIISEQLRAVFQKYQLGGRTKYRVQLRSPWRC